MAEPKKRSKALQLYAKYLLQRDAQNPEAENTLNQFNAELNEVHDLDSFIDEIKYRWKGNPWLGGYNKTLDIIFNPSPSNYETFKSMTEPSTYRTLFKWLNIPTKNPDKKQQGGQLNMNEQELQKEFAQYLVKESGANSEKELQEYVKKLGKEGLQKKYQEFLASKKKTKIARHGAKLDYIKRLTGTCQEDEELVYMKIGGKFCKKCQKKALEDKDMGALPYRAAKTGTKLVQDFKEACGGRMKKKREEGGLIDWDKCGKKMKKKCENGGLIDQAKCGKKMKKKCEEGGEMPPQQPKKKPSVPQKKKPLVPQRNKQPELTGERRAVRDSILANRYNDDEVLSMMPGRVTKNGKWSPDRTQYPYKSKR